MELGVGLFQASDGQPQVTLDGRQRAMPQQVNTWRKLALLLTV